LTFCVEKEASSIKGVLPMRSIMLSGRATDDDDDSDDGDVAAVVVVVIFYFAFFITNSRSFWPLSRDKSS
jgi:hypothetical protein